MAKNMTSRKAYFKRVSHKKMRRHKDTCGKGNWANKLFDYWWTIW